MRSKSDAPYLREIGFREIVGASEEEQVKRLPDVVQLPTVVMKGITRAVAKTERTGARQIFGSNRHPRGWKNGVMLGSLRPGRDSLGPNVSRMGAFARSYYRNTQHDLLVHTHPSPAVYDREFARALADRHMEVPVSGRSADEQLIAKHLKELYMLPNQNDMFAFAEHRAGMLGNVVATAGGIFLMIERDANRPSAVSNPKYERRTHDMLRRGYADLRQDPPPEAARETMFQATATAASDYAICYFTPDPMSAQLSRLALFSPV